MRKQVLYQPTDAFNQGVQFLAAAEQLARSPNYILAPIVVNAAFAVECLLKACLAAKNKHSSGHELKKLFDAAFDDVSERTEFVALVSAASQLTIDQVEDDLALCSKNFENYRYVFESYPQITSVPGPVPNLGTNPGLLIYMGRQLEVYFQYLTKCQKSTVRSNPLFSESLNFGLYDHTIYKS